MNRPANSTSALVRQRSAARRTALTIGTIALVIYIAFILRGVLGA